jgi:hypothetical protein
VEHSLQSPLDLPADSWRRLSYLLGALAALEALVILVAGVVFLAKPFAHELKHVALNNFSSAEGKTGPHTPAGKPKLVRDKVVVMVLNGNGINGAAGRNATRLRRLGYKIGTVGNAERTDYPRSLVLYRRGYRPEAVRLARDVHAKIAAPIDGIRTKQLGRAELAYVVGAN